jgi:hypothetical protein
MTGMRPGARVSLAAMTIGLSLLIGCGALLVWFGLVGYEDWDGSQRAIVLVLGRACGIGFSALLALLLRQQVAGLPPVRGSRPGLAIGSTVIPWGEIDEVRPTSILAIPHLAIVQAATAPRRLRGLRALQYMPMGDARALVVSERQLGGRLEAAIQEIQQAWSQSGTPDDAAWAGNELADRADQRERAPQGANGPAE